MRWAFKMYDEDNSREVDINEMENVMVVGRQKILRYKKIGTERRRRNRMKIYAMTTIQEIITTRIHQMKLYPEFPEGNIQHARGRGG